MSFAPDGIKKTYYKITGTKDGKPFKAGAVGVQGIDTVEQMQAHFDKFKPFPGVTDLKVELDADPEGAAASQPKVVSDTLSLAGAQ